MLALDNMNFILINCLCGIVMICSFSLSGNSDLTVDDKIKYDGYSLEWNDAINKTEKGHEHYGREFWKNILDFNEYNLSLNYSDDDDITDEPEGIALSDEDRLSEAFIFEITYRFFGSCLHFPAFSPNPIYMVTHCPMNFYHKNIISYCHHGNIEGNLDKCVIDMENIPVQDFRGIVYRNMYCSMCHNAQNVTSWTANLESNDISSVKVVDGLESVSIMQNLGDVLNCTQRIYPFHQHDIIHCNTDEIQTPRRRDISDIGSVAQPANFLLSFQIFINFGINGKGHMIFSTEPVNPPDEQNHKCDENEVYYKGSCRLVTCEEGYHFVQSNCRPNVQTYVEDPKEAGKAISNLKYVSDLMNVTLKLNVTREELILLDQRGSEEVVMESLANLLNVSESRVRNLTMECDAGTSTGHVLEFHAVGDSAKVRMRYHETSMNITSTPADLNDETKDNNNDYKPLNDQRVDTEVIPDTYSNGVLNCNINSNNMYSFQQEDMFTVSMHFVLVGGKKKSSKKYVSAQKVVKNMKEMINSKSFNLIINGTDLHVTEYVEKPESTSIGSWCAHGQQEMKDGDEVVIMEFRDNRTGQMVRGVYVNATQKYYGPDLFDLYLMVSGEIGSITNVTTVAFVYICNEPRIENNECAKITASVQDYVVLSNNSIVFENETFSMSNYEYKNNTSHDIFICIPTEDGSVLSLMYVTSACGAKFSTVVIAEGYLSFILGVISIIVTFAVLVTYCLFKNLRNLPGINTMNLTLAIFLGELLFITSGIVKPESKWACKLFGVLLHYLFLSAFFWMNVMSFDVFRTFANKCILTRVRSVRKFFPRYALYAWGSPAGIVVVCCIIDFTAISSTFRIGYGGSNIYETLDSLSDSMNTSSIDIKIHSGQNLGCWIQEPVAAFVAFGLPMVLILISNAVMFTRTIICIRKTSQLVKFKTRRSSRSSLNHMTGKDDVMLYVRMSTMMGFTWTIGLASSIVSAFAGTATDTMCIVLHILGILFVAFNCSQGLFIFCAFVFNKRVGQYYKELIIGCRKNGNLSTSTSTRTLNTTTGSFASNLDKL